MGDKKYLTLFKCSRPSHFLRVLRLLLLPCTRNLLIISLFYEVILGTHFGILWVFLRSFLFSPWKIKVAFAAASSAIFSLSSRFGFPSTCSCSSNCSLVPLLTWVNRSFHLPAFRPFFPAWKMSKRKKKDGREVTWLQSRAITIFNSGKN